MSIQIKEIESSETPAGMPALPTASINAHDFDALVTNMKQEFNLAAGQAVDRAYSYADSVSKQMLARVKEELAGYAKPKTQILAVEVDKTLRKLSKPANPLLGRMIVNAKLGINTMLVGPAGCGKTTAGEQLAEALGLPFGHIGFTAGASETWLAGRQLADGFHNSDFGVRYENGGVMLLDEIDKADANMTVFLNNAIENGSFYNPISGKRVTKHPNFILVAAANTFGRGGNMVYAGATRLDGSFLDRFEILEMTYSDAIEAELCPDEELRATLKTAREKLKDLKAKEIISSRRMLRAYQLKQAGISLSDILASLTAGWNTDLVKQCGLNG